MTMVQTHQELYADRQRWQSKIQKWQVESAVWHAAQNCLLAKVEQGLGSHGESLEKQAPRLPVHEGEISDHGQSIAECEAASKEYHHQAMARIELLIEVLNMAF